MAILPGDHALDLLDASRSSLLFLHFSMRIHLSETVSRRIISSLLWAASFWALWKKSKEESCELQSLIWHQAWSSCNVLLTESACSPQKEDMYACWRASQHVDWVRQHLTCFSEASSKMTSSWSEALYTLVDLCKIWGILLTHVHDDSGRVWSNKAKGKGVRWFPLDVLVQLKSRIAC